MPRVPSLSAAGADTGPGACGAAGARARVEHGDAVRCGQNGVEADLRELRQVAHHAGQPQQQLFQGGEVDRSGGVGAEQQRGAARGGDQVVDVVVGERCQAGGVVGAYPVRGAPRPNSTRGPKTSSWTAPANSSVPRAASGWITTPVRSPANPVPKSF